jgi:hypothetical protein
MSNKKQTSVEWLEEQIRFHISNSDKLIPLFDQAKAMQKEQGKELYFEATKYACSCYDGPTKEDFEEDYNEIYGK